MAAAPGKCFLVTGPPGVGKTTLVMRVLESLRDSHPDLRVRGFYTREVREGSQRVGFEIVTLDGRRGPLAVTSASRSLEQESITTKRILTCQEDLVSSCVSYLFTERGLKKSRSLEQESITTKSILTCQEDLVSSCVSYLFTERGLKKSSTESLRWPAVGKYTVDVESFESLALPELQVKEDTELFIIDEVGKMELYSSSFFPAVLRVLESGIPLLASIPIPKAGRDIPAVARLRNYPGAAVYLLNRGNRDAIKEQVYSQLVNLLPKR